MSDLNQSIDAASKFQGEKPVEVPAVDHSGQTQVGLDWASRQQAQQPEQPEVKQMPPITPVAN